MRILVLLKYSKGEINPFDAAALECALSMKAEVTVLTMAPPSVKDDLLKLTRLGLFAVLVSDPKLAGSDTLVTSAVLARAIERLSPDVVFAGRQSVDGDTGQVPPMIAERLGMRFIPRVIEMSEDDLTLRSGDRVKLTEGSVVTFEKIRALRFPSIFSRVGDVTVLDNSHLAFLDNEVGLAGSPTRVVRSYESTVGRRSCIFEEPSKLDLLIKEALLRNKRDAVIEESSEKLPFVLFVGDRENAARAVASEYRELAYEGRDLSSLEEEIRALKPSAVLFEDTDTVKEIGARLAVRMGVGMCADCISLSVRDGGLVMTRPALGGNITADIISPKTPVFASVRGVKKNLGDLIFAVGVGALPYLEKIRALAEKYGAELCSSRPLADSGKMPYSSQIGITGRVAAPRVYVCFGVSGAVQHTSAIVGAGTVIAVNSERHARIFDFADYGIVADIEKILGE